MWTDDPIADFERWDKEREDALTLLPICTICEERIQDDFCYEINGELVCEHCMELHYRKSTTDFIM